MPGGGGEDLDVFGMFRIWMGYEIIVYVYVMYFNTLD